MKIPKKLEDMDQKELKELLEKKRDLYDEVKEEMHFTLKNAGHHLPGDTRDEYEEELEEIEQKINQIKSLLNN